MRFIFPFSTGFNLVSKNIMLSKAYSSDVEQPKVLICNWQEGVFASTSSAFKH